MDSDISAGKIGNKQIESLQSCSPLAQQKLRANLLRLFEFGLPSCRNFCLIFQFQCAEAKSCRQLMNFSPVYPPEGGLIDWLFQPVNSGVGHSITCVHYGLHTHCTRCGDGCWFRYELKDDDGYWWAGLNQVYIGQLIDNAIALADVENNGQHNQQ